MKTQSGFTLMTVDEFENWIASQRVTRGIQLVQLHHTWSPAYAQFTGSNHFALQSGMKSYHLSIDYDDIAQNLTIFPDGQVMTGRSLNVAPAGCKGANSNGICIENIGNFDVGGDTMTEAHKDAIVRVTAALLKKFGLSPASGVTYHAWWTEGGTSLGTYIAGKSCKTCPGTAFFGGNTRASYDKCLKPLLMAAMNGSYQNTEEDDDMISKEQFREMWLQMRKDLQDNDSSTYSAEAREWAISNGIIQGSGTLADGSPNYMWEDIPTREQLVTLLYRFAQQLGKA